MPARDVTQAGRLDVQGRGVPAEVPGRSHAAPPAAGRPGHDRGDRRTDTGVSADHLLDHHRTTRRKQRGPIPDNTLRTIRIVRAVGGQAVQHTGHQDRDGPAPVEEAPDRLPDRTGAPDVAPDDQSVRVVVQRGERVGQDHRINIDVDHPGPRTRRLGDLMHVAVQDREPTAQIQELGNPRPGQESHGVPQEGPATAGELPHPGHHLHQRRTGRPVRGIVLHAAQQPVMHPRGPRDRRVLKHRPDLTARPAATGLTGGGHPHRTPRRRECPDGGGLSPGRAQGRGHRRAPGAVAAASRSTSTPAPTSSTATGPVRLHGAVSHRNSGDGGSTSRCSPDRT